MQQNAGLKSLPQDDLLEVGMIFLKMKRKTTEIAPAYALYPAKFKKV